MQLGHYLATLDIPGCLTTGMQKLRVETGIMQDSAQVMEDQPLEESLDTEADIITDMSSVRSQMRQPCSLTPPGPDCADLSLVSTNQRPESWASGQSEARVIS